MEKLSSRGGWEAFPTCRSCPGLQRDSSVWGWPKLSRKHLCKTSDSFRLEEDQSNHISRRLKQIPLKTRPVMMNLRNITSAGIVSLLDTARSTWRRIYHLRHT